METENIVIKPFKTPNGFYVYDRETNNMLEVKEHEFIALRNVEHNKASENDLLVLKRFQEQGFCLETRLRQIEHPETRFLAYHLSSKVRMITLQVTQNCNLRCKYCTYSGGYEQRMHAKKTMPWDVMKKSVDFYMEHSRNTESSAIGFFGGEPLLAFANIRQCVHYVKTEYPGRNVRFVMTTNGTLFDDLNIRFLQENDFNITISLDGTKELHDINRVFINGEGSFDTIIKNLTYIKEQYPAFFKKISFNTVVAPGNDCGCINDFFSASELFEDNSLRINTVSTVGAKEPIMYDDQYFITSKYENIKIYMSMLGLYDKKKTSKLFAEESIRTKRLYKSLGKTRLSECAHHGGPCVAGEQRPFIDIEGNLYPCERVSELSDAMKIGNIYSGFDINKADKLINVGTLTKEKCLNCWNYIHCGICSSLAVEGNELKASAKLRHCEGYKYDTLEKMKMICLLKKNRYDFESEE